jgi:hypothetical protein
MSWTKSPTCTLTECGAAPVGSVKVTENSIAVP